MDSVKDDKADPSVLDAVREKVGALCKQHPVYAD